MYTYMCICAMSSNKFVWWHILTRLGDHCEMFRNTESLCCVTGTSVVLLVSYTSKTKKERNKLRKRDQICAYQRQRVGSRGNWMKAVKRYKFLVIRYISTKDGIYSMINIINIAVCFIWKLRGQTLSSHNKKIFIYVSIWDDEWSINLL